jgi:TolB-like protein
VSFDLSKWLSDLRRRHVFRAAAIYAAVAWAVVQVADVVVPATGMPDWVLTAIVILAILGFPVVMVLSWLFDVGKGSIVRTRPGSASGILTIVFSVASLAIGTTGIVLLLKPGLNDDSTGVTTRPNAADNSLAVLPFDNLSPDPDNEYFSDGLTDTLLHTLAGVQELKVAARTSSFAFKGQERDIREIAQTIGVSHVLEGSVQRSNDRIRVTAQLVRANDGYRVWSRSFDDVVEDIFSIQDEIAREVANQLAASLLETGTKLQPDGISTENLEAYDLYLRAREVQHRTSVEGLTQSIQLLQQALIKDPDFLDAKVELAFRHAGMGNFEPGDELDDAVALLEQVLAMDPNHSKARMLRSVTGMVSSIFAADMDGFNAWYQQMEAVYAAHPADHEIAAIAARMLMGTNQLERALAIHEELLAADPLNISLLIATATNLQHLGQFQRARTVVDRALQLDPRNSGVHQKAATLSQVEGDGIAYLRHMMRAAELDPLNRETHAYTAIFLYSNRLIDEGDLYRDKLLSLAPDAPISNFVQVNRAVAAQNGEEIYKLVRERIRGYGGSGCCSFWDGLEQLVRQAALDDRLPETLAFIEEHRPGFTDLERFDMPIDVLITRLRQINAIRGERSMEEMEAYFDRVNAMMRARPGSNGRGMPNSPRVYAGVLVMRGDVEAAADVVLEGMLSDARIHFQDWREYFSQPCFEELVEVPRVREALERWDEEERQFREAVRELFLDS